MTGTSPVSGLRSDRDFNDDRCIMSSKRRWPSFTIEAILWIAVLAFVGYRIWPQAAAAIGYGAGGTQAPEIQVQTLDGRTVALSDLQGQVVLVNFWATWCPPCRWEMPGFQRTYEAYRDQGFTILGLSTDRMGRRAVQEFLDEYGITYPVAMAPAGSEHAFGGIRVMPTSFLIDRQGRIRHTVRGYFSETALDQAVRKLLAEDSENSESSRATPSETTATGSVSTAVDAPGAEPALVSEPARMLEVAR